MLLLALALAATSDAPLIPAFFTGADLYKICSQPNAGQCSMYVAGVLDGAFYTRSKTEQPQLCPARMNNREAARIVTEFLAANADFRRSAAAVGVRAALAGKLECDRPQLAGAAASDG